MRTHCALPWPHRNEVERYAYIDAVHRHLLCRRYSQSRSRQLNSTIGTILHANWCVPLYDSLQIDSHATVVDSGCIDQGSTKISSQFVQFLQ